MVLFAVLCAILPLGFYGVLLTSTEDSQSFEPVASSIDASAKNQLQLGIKAHANRISSRLAQISYSVRQLKNFAQEILSNQEFYGGATSISPPQDSEPDSNLAPLDNILYYSLGEDNAIRRLVNDGSPSAFFSSRNFSSHDMQRLYASAALDPLLVAPCLDEPLVGRSFLVTTDNLVRTYPYYNFAHWAGDTDVSKPRNYWSQAKADENGIVWTAPYQSIFDGQWVVACLAQVTLGGRSMGVAGCELPLKPLAENLLVFSLGSGGMAWIVKPGAADDKGGWWTLTTQPGAEDYLRVVPVAAASLPTDKHPQSEILVEADLAIHAPDVVTKNLDAIRGGTDEAIEVDGNNGGQLLSSFPIATTGWLLCGTITNDAKRAASTYALSLQDRFRNKVVLFLLAALLGVGLAIVLANLESRRIAKPLALLAQLVVKAKHDPNVSFTEFSNLGEINTLTSAIKDLVDSRKEPFSPQVDDGTDDTPDDATTPPQE